jgi:hypothetical protein
MNSADSLVPHHTLSHADFYPVFHPKNKLSTEEEKNRLMKQIESLSVKNKALAESQQNLQGTVINISI